MGATICGSDAPHDSHRQVECLPQQGMKGAVQAHYANSMDGDKAISMYMKEVEEKSRSVIKILLLGSGSSGKSTLFHQIDRVHGNKSKPERFFQNLPYVARTIRVNCVNALLKLLTQSMVLSEEPYNLTTTTIDVSEPGVTEAIKLLARTEAKDVMSEPSDSELKALGLAMELLWSLNGVAETFKHRHNYSLVENTDYFLDKVRTVMIPNYQPTMEDILNARMVTTGIVDRHYVIESNLFNIFDVGGQRNERRKWLALFDSVQMLIFVAALNHYSCALFEDETKNAMQESLELFQEIATSKWFPPQHTQFVLFLNKNDLFKRRLQVDKIKLSVSFGDKYQSVNYTDKNDQEMTEHEQREWFSLCYREALSFIKAQYFSRMGNRHKLASVFTHVTTATEKANIETVFEDVTKGLLTQRLNSCHLK